MPLLRPHQDSRMTPAQRNRLSRNTRTAMQGLIKDHSHTLHRALRYTKNHPGVQVPLFKRPALGVQQVLASFTKSCGLGPYRWHQNAQGFWFLVYTP